MQILKPIVHETIWGGAKLTPYSGSNSTKIGHTAPVKFGNFSDAWLITTNVKDKELKKEKNIIEVRK